ncbi:alpha/beta hydrolase [Halioxenophilus sp. WMMB6]|uniref:alpha/beta hydrolase n=1 Tax=Halioxenophilus sp. WMMB6 TaxID=3073815 RepID=UPI00295F0BB0|nr:alpha/beta hydrolase [Halioxenophilus sp. WMMB6]
MHLIATDQQQPFMAEVAANHNGSPWLLFIHGNNQTLASSLRACRKLQKNFGVNVVLFSWPSRSYYPRSLHFLAASLLFTLHPSTRSIARIAAAKSIHEQQKQYQQARKIAEQSVPALGHSLHILHRHLLQPLSAEGVNCHLLVHSLGHYLLQRLAKEGAMVGDWQCRSAIFHQADLAAADSLEWLDDLPFINRERLFVTHNRRDYALFFSGLWHNNFHPGKVFSRLGNGMQVDISYPFNLVDFTHEKGVGLRHAIFWRRDLSPELKQRLLSLLS